jgi:hypothetical protein
LPFHLQSLQSIHLLPRRLIPHLPISYSQPEFLEASCGRYSTVDEMHDAVYRCLVVKGEDFYRCGHGSGSSVAMSSFTRAKEYPQALDPFLGQVPYHEVPRATSRRYTSFKPAVTGKVLIFRSFYICFTPQRLHLVPGHLRGPPCAPPFRRAQPFRHACWPPRHGLLGRPLPHQGSVGMRETEISPDISPGCSRVLPGTLGCVWALTTFGFLLQHATVRMHRISSLFCYSLLRCSIQIEPILPSIP